MKLTQSEQSELAQSLRQDLDEAIVQHELSESDAERARQQARIEILTLAHMRLTETKLESMTEEAPRRIAVEHDAARDVALGDLLAISHRMGLLLLAHAPDPAGVQYLILLVRLAPLRVALVGPTGEVISAPGIDGLDPGIVSEFGEACGSFVVQAMNAQDPAARQAIGSAMSQGAGLSLTILPHRVAVHLEHTDHTRVEIATARYALH